MSEEKDIDELVNQFFNVLSIETVNPNQDIKMTTQTQNGVNYTLLKMFIDTIHPYNGESNTLMSFLSAGDFLFTTYGNINDDILKQYLIRTIRMKLIDRAQILVGCRMELQQWDQIKTVLYDCFGDKRNLECLEQDLFMATPQKNEHPLDFARRLQVLRSNLAQKINSITDAIMNKDTKLIYLRQYDQVCLRTFIRGIPGPLQSLIRLKNPNCIEVAMTQITEEENFHYTQNLFKAPEQPKMVPKPQSFQNRNFNNQNSPQNSFRQNYTQRPFYNNNFNSMQNPNFNSNNNRPMTFQQQQPPMQNFSQNPTFPSAPVNVQPRFNNNRHYPTNRQVFGPPKNVFKPTGQVPTNKPEPMSTTSRNTMPREQYRSNQSNYFKPNGPQNFRSQELFHIDENDVTQNNAAGIYNNVLGAANTDNDTQETIETYYDNNNFTEQPNTDFTNQNQNLSEYTDFTDYCDYPENYQDNQEYQNFTIPGQSNSTS